MAVTSKAARDSTKHLQYRITILTPKRKDHPAPNINTATVEKPFFLQPSFFESIKINEKHQFMITN